MSPLERVEATDGRLGKFVEPLEDVAPVVTRLAALVGQEPNILFSVRRFKQCGARYFS